MKYKLLVVLILSLPTALSYGQAPLKPKSVKPAIGSFATQLIEEADEAREKQKIYDQYVKAYLSVDSLWKLYTAKKITNIAAEITKLKLDDVLELHVRSKSGYMNLTVHCYDNEPLTVFKALEKARLIPSLSLLKIQKRLHFETEGDPGDTVFAEYDPDEPNYGLNTSNTQSQDKYMKVIIAMTNTPNMVNQLQKDHNDLLSYKALEKSNKTPVLTLRRKFIKFLHGKYDIPYPKIY